MNDENLIQQALDVVRHRKVDSTEMGQVGAALLSANGNVYLGVCIDVSSSMGFCAEHAAIAAMVTSGEYVIERIVAVWKDEDGVGFVAPPCGRCREFMRQIDERNLDARVIIGPTETVTLRELLPFADTEWSPTDATG